ncbi:MAG: hypothetical protein GEU97_18205 [Actinophytocola sp.]|nr:hypothetical protein [Actinophytocola sp.]
MKIPDRSEFAELSKVTTQLGLQDPTEVLPQLQNQLEAVPASAESIRTIASGLRTAATDLNNEIGAVTWTGYAADAFRNEANNGIAELNRAAGVLDELAGQLDVTPEQVKKVILTVLKYLGRALLLAGAIGAIMAAVGIGGPVVLGLAIAGLIGVLLSIDAALISDFPFISEHIAAVINAILDLLCPDEPHPREA